MRAIIPFFGEPMMYFVIGLIIAIIVAVIVFGVKPDALTNLLGGFAPR